ncbi:hypothetical protein BLOT_008948 [Blomia tropicalis]|nr:hypothetical protein BLOT_008948 [Blomia tropicalis]
MEILTMSDSHSSGCTRSVDGDFRLPNLVSQNYGHSRISRKPPMHRKSFSSSTGFIEFNVGLSQ